MKTYRLLENGEVFWQGRAHDPEHAAEKAFWDEQPASLCRYTLQYWGKVNWVTVYKNQPIYLYV